jgi:tetratricopeptide (TPR) repeat protein
VAARAARLAGLGLVLALVFSTARVQPFVERPYLHTNLYLPSGKFVEQAALGYRELAADMVWFQAVQYYGGYAKSEHDLAYFAGLIGIVNQLDPHFVFPYVFGAVVLAQDLGALDEGIQVLRRGMERNPQSWELPFEIGFLYYTVARDKPSAAHYFDLASRLPGGAEIAARFAAFVYSKAGHRETSIRMWEEIEREAEQPYMREMAKRYLVKLRAQAAMEKAKQGARSDGEHGDDI